MGTVKYTGPVASFHCPTNAEIRSLKVHFSPKQEGSGDPSPENVREIVGWDWVKVNKSGRNLMHLIGYSAVNLTTTTATRTLTNGNGTTINTIDPEKSVTITQTLWPATNKSSYQNGYFVVMDDNLKFEERYDISFRVTNIINNPLNAALSDLAIYNPKGSSVGSTKIIDGDRITFKNAIYNQNTTTPLRHGFDIRICGMSCTISDFIITAVDIEDRTYEPYHGSTTNYEFGVLGKNKFNKNDSEKIISGLQILSSEKIGGSSTSTTVFVPCQPNTTYTISKLATARAAISYAITDTIPQIDDSIYGYQNIANQSTATIATGDNAKWLCIYITNTNYDSTSVQDILDSLQVELGSTATTYEPYNPNHTIYGGWVDLITGEVEEEYGIFETKWGAMGNANVRGNYERRELSVSSIGFIGASAGDLNNRPNRRFCNVAPWRWDYYGDQLHYYADMGIAYVFLPINSDDNITIRIVCYLATPITYHLAPTQLQTFLGQNNVWSNADYVEVEYDLHETQDILARKQFIVANQPHIVKPAAAPLQNFTTDVPAPLKECKVHFEPKQDLHGYDKPWVGGGGKNIAKPYDNNYVSSTYVSFDYSAANGTFRCYGTASASSTHSSPSATNAANNGATFTLPAGTYTLSIIDGDGANIYAQCVSSTETVLAETTSYITFTTNESLTVFVRLKVAAGATVDNTVKIQLEAGSTATSYVPYENVCPISGRTGINVNHVNKSIFPFLVTSMTNARGTMYNGYNEWCQQSSNFNHLSGVKLTYSVYVDATNAESTDNSNVRIWGKYKDGSWAFLATGGNNIAPGASGVSVKTITIPNNLDWIAFGLGLAKNVVVSNPIVEVGDTRTEYEPYNGETIPITFPATKNLFDEKYEGITKSIIYRSIYVGEGTVIASTTTPRYYPQDVPSGYSNLFVFPGQVTTGAGTGTNDICIGTTRTVTPIDGYITIAYRSTNNVDPRNYQTQIERGTTATAYEPYGTIYGGYVDLVTGEVVREAIKVTTNEIVSFHDITDRGNGVYEICLNLPIYARSERRAEAKCNCFVYGNTSTGIADRFDLTYVLNQKARQVRISHYFEEAPTIEVYKEYLQSIGFEIVYYIDQENYPIDPIALKTLRSTNIIWSTTNGTIDLAYWSH